jgi:hypothetical protein
MLAPAERRKKSEVRGARRNTHMALLRRKVAAVAVLVRDPSTNNAG